MLGSYVFVEGAALTGLILEIREEFVARVPYDLDDARRPNSVHAVAIDVYDAKTTDERLAILRDLIDGNANLLMTREPQDVFIHADVPGAYLTDLVCEVARQILLRDPSVRDENDRRVTLAGDDFS
jgi:hypothetical protein